MKIPVLFTQVNTNYNDYPIFDTYDLHRDAFSYYGRIPVIAHPPCRLFSRLRKFSTATATEKKCAFFALSKVRQFGGILEHPRSSTLWKTGNFDLSGAVDSYGGFLRSVNLSWFGFPCQKKTMLYFVGIAPGQLPPFPLSLDAISHRISSSKNNSLPEIAKTSRSTTPLGMITYFADVITIINKNRSSL